MNLQGYNGRAFMYCCADGCGLEFRSLSTSDGRGAFHPPKRASHSVVPPRSPGEAWLPPAWSQASLDTVWTARNERASDDVVDSFQSASAPRAGASIGLKVSKHMQSVRRTLQTHGHPQRRRQEPASVVHVDC